MYTVCLNNKLTHQTSFSDPESSQQTSYESERWLRAWKTISYRRRKSDDVASKWKSLVGAVKRKNKL
jgi:hypothetical protein